MTQTLPPDRTDPAHGSLLHTEGIAGEALWREEGRLVFAGASGEAGADSAIVGIRIVAGCGCAAA